MYRKPTFLAKLPKSIYSSFSNEFKLIYAVFSKFTSNVRTVRSRGLRKKWVKKSTNLFKCFPFGASQHLVRQKLEMFAFEDGCKNTTFGERRFQVTRKYTRALVRYANTIILISYSRLIRVTVRTTIRNCFSFFFWTFFFISKDRRHVQKLNRNLDHIMTILPEQKASLRVIVYFEKMYSKFVKCNSSKPTTIEMLHLGRARFHIPMKRYRKKKHYERRKKFKYFFSCDQRNARL